MLEPAKDPGEDGDAEESYQDFFVTTPIRASLKWLPIKGRGTTTILRDKAPAWEPKEGFEEDSAGE